MHTSPAVITTSLLSATNGVGMLLFGSWLPWVISGKPAGTLLSRPFMWLISAGFLLVAAGMLMSATHTIRGNLMWAKKGLVLTPWSILLWLIGIDLVKYDLRDQFLIIFFTLVIGLALLIITQFSTIDTLKKRNTTK